MQTDLNLLVTTTFFDLPLVYVMHEYCGFKTLACFEAGIAICYFGQKK